MPVTGFNWTEERTEQCKVLWADGKSASLIACALVTIYGGRLSRNAVIGKLHRLGLKRLGTRVKSETHKQTQKLLRNDARERFKNNGRRAWAELTDLPEDEIPATAVTLHELRDHHCRWPVKGSGAGMLYCGADPFDRMPYCGGHCRIAYAPPRR